MGDEELVRRLREGDESAFAALVASEHPRLVRLARTFVPSQAVAEEVAQETWVGVLKGLDRFEGRSALRTWIFKILVNRARTTGVREHRSTPVADPYAGEGGGGDEERFAADGSWAEPPERWSEALEDRMEAAQLAGLVRRSIEGLPANQREVVTMRDLDGLSGRDVCDVLGISDGNQRILLHRGRAAVRRAVEAELKGA